MGYSSQNLSHRQDRASAAEERTDTMSINYTLSPEGTLMGNDELAIKTPSLPTSASQLSKGACQMALYSLYSILHNF